MTTELSTVGVTINGTRQVPAGDPRQRLSELLRNDLGLQGTKIGCDAGDCGACTVLVDRAPVCACLTPAGSVVGSSVESVEGLADTELGAALATSFVHHGAAQCGFCTPGMLMAALALLRDNPTPNRDEVVAGLSGVLCRCTGYQKIVDAVIDHATLPKAIQPSVGKAVGHRLPRVDASAKVDGSERFGADGIPSTALQVLIVRSPHNAATFAFGDIASYIATTPGVSHVLTVDHIAGENSFGVIPGHEDQPVLAEGQTRFFGEAVCLVVGDGIDASVLDPFPITWTQIPHVLSTAEALAPTAGSLHGHAPDNVLIRGRVRRSDPVERREQAVTVTGSFTTSFVEHAYIEPEAGWADFVDGILTINVTTQAPYMDRQPNHGPPRHVVVDHH